MTTFRALSLRLLRAADAAATRVYGWRRNPLHQSGALAVTLLVLLIGTGLFLLVGYRVSAPWQSVAALQAQPWLGRWMRSLHRFASDAMIVAVVVHAWRMFAQRRSWGPRVLAWTSGVMLLFVLFVSGWTGYVLVWDTFGAQLAVGGARLFDTLPVLSEPVRRIFAGDESVPAAFFFINLFLHIAVPLGAGVALWIHVSRLARPTLSPPRALAMWVIGALTALAIVAPVQLADEAAMLTIPRSVPMDGFYAFWLPWADALPPIWAWVGAIGTLALALAVPRLTRQPRTDEWAPSVVDPRLCTGCDQCPQDCPWDAITMQPRDDGRVGLVAHVDEAKCVSCGICAGSCAPMGVGPALRTGRDQLAALRRHLQLVDKVTPARRVAICCEHAAPSHLEPLRALSADIQLVPCAGNVHSSVVERNIRQGAAGVMIYTCAPRDCRGREGPKWLHERMYNGREAELQPRVDISRVASAVMAPGDLQGTLDAWRHFAGEPPRPASRARRAAWRVAAVGVSVVALLLLRAGSWVPVSTAAEGATLRLSWSAHAERIEQCRRLSDAELAELPQHMRMRWSCEGKSATYLLTATVDDRTMVRDTVRGGGLRHDRPLHLFREYAMPAGTHRLVIALQRIEVPTPPDSADGGKGASSGAATTMSREARESQERSVRRAQALPALVTLDTTISVAAGRVALVTYHDTQRRLTLHAAP
ncbi:MAG: cytochrome b N-terminal domain-containing protein [Gemmatimonadaceae bacterium]